MRWVVEIGRRFFDQTSIMAGRAIQELSAVFAQKFIHPDIYRIVTRKPDIRNEMAPIQERESAILCELSFLIDC
jgi:hypothetical protein